MYYIFHMDTFDLRKWQGFTEAGGSSIAPATIEDVVIDSRRVFNPKTLFVALPGSKCDGHQFVEQACREGAKFIIVRKDYVPPEEVDKEKLLFVDDPLFSLQDIAKTYRESKSCKVVGILGSYGKTMVKDFLFSILENSSSVVASPESFNSQIGVPLSLFKINDEHKIAIIEAGISHPGEIDRLQGMIRPDFTILTHIGQKHITTLGSMDTIAAEFSKFVESTSLKGWVLIPKTDLMESKHGNKYYWNADGQNLPHAKIDSNQKSYNASFRIDFPDGDFLKGDIKVGHYFWVDLLNLVIKPAYLLGIEKEDICQAVKNYTPDLTRVEIAKSQNGALFINDTYSEDPQSIDAALDKLENFASSGKKYFLFTGLKKATTEKEIGRIALAAKNKGVDELIYIGKEKWSNSRSFANFDRGLKYLKDKLRPQDTLLIKGKKKESLDNIVEHLNGSISTNQCFINLAEVEDNLKIITSILPQKTRIMPMIKASAYGTDEIIMAKFLQSLGIDILGVSYVDEAIALRKAEIKTSVFVLNAALYEVNKIVQWDLEIGVSSVEMIYALEDAASKKKKKIKVHLHVDTGMKRLGCRPDQAVNLADKIEKSPHLVLEGVMTHFAAADDVAEDSFTEKQAKLFQQVIEALKKKNISPPWLHAANSHFALRFDNSAFNMARIGISLFGFSSVKNNDLRPAISLTSKIVGINECLKGETVSYGREYMVTRENQKIAVIPIGYFDGLHRHFSGKGFVIIHGQKAPQVGNICMDYMMVDITELQAAKIGDPVLIFGRDEYGNSISLPELATSVGSIAYELITCLGPRIQRVFYYEENYD